MALSSLPSPRSLAFSAFVSGSLVRVVLRSSLRSASGRVVVASFRCPVRAGRFARRWAARLGVSVAVRRSGGLWLVSVPCLRSGFLPGAPVWVCALGGLRAFVSALAWGCGPFSRLGGVCCG